MKDARESLASNPIQSMTTPSDKCTVGKCDGKGWIWYKDWSRTNLKDEFDENGNTIKRAEWMEKCTCYVGLVKQRIIDRNLDLACVPPIFANVSVKSFDVDKYKSKSSKDTAEIAKKAATNYVVNYQAMRERGKGLYFYSKTKGSGKTRLAISIANALVKMYGVNFAIIKSADLITQIKKSFGNKEGPTQSEIVQSLRDVELLVVDDLAMKGATDFEEGIFYDITDFRLEHNKPTIFTSNVPVEDLEQIYPGGRVNQRVKKMTIEIYMPEESVRNQEADDENAEMERILFK